MWVLFRCVKTKELNLVNLEKVEHIACNKRSIVFGFGYNIGIKKYYYDTEEDTQKMCKRIVKAIQKDTTLVLDIDEKDIK